MWGFLKTFADWLRTYESVAIWLEGIALVAIFIWDRIDSRQQHKETREQLLVSQSQVEAAIKSADAAKISAEAAKQSADVAAALNRPFIGLESRPIKSLSVHSLWTTSVALANYGTLPATNLNASFEFHTESPQESRFPLQTISGPESAEIFPRSEYEADLSPAINLQQQTQIASRLKDLILIVKATYGASEGRKFGYTAEAKLDIASGRFKLLKSKTHAI
jgi:hypothetical protein